MRVTVAAALLVWLAGCQGCQADRRVHVAIATAAPATTVSDRYLSIAIDTAQVVGGIFWSAGETSAGGAGQVPPFDFTRPRLVALARPLGHAYLRVGGTDADRTWFAANDPPPAAPPSGYQWILTRAEVDAMAAFAGALDFQILFTLNAGSGPRVANGPWLPDNAQALVGYTRSIGAPVTVWELGNEVNAYSLILGFSLSASEYARDVRTARTMLAGVAPTAKLAGPASAYWPIIGEVGGLLPAFAEVGGDSVDLITWHYYPQESARCPVAVRSATPTRLLDPDNLDEIDRWADDVKNARDRWAASAQAWLDETSNAQCGGAPGISDAFVSSLWWLDQLGKMARRGTPVVIRQSLTGADYGLLAEPSLDPRPDYFATLLWRRLMGARVLAATVQKTPTLRAYAHCTAAEAPGFRAGAVTVLAINLDASQPIHLALDGVGGGFRAAFIVSADDLQAPVAKLNGTPLIADADGTLPALTPATGVGRSMIVPAASYAFIVFPDANAAACRP
jgi:heparanase 1